LRLRPLRRLPGPQGGLTHLGKVLQSASVGETPDVSEKLIQKEKTGQTLADIEVNL